MSKHIAITNYYTPSKKVSASQGWATISEMAEYSSGNSSSDVLLGKNASLAFFEKDKTWEHGVNSNVFVFGGTGSGKTRSFIEPNLAQHLNCSYVVADPKGELLRTMGQGFKNDGYEITVIDTINPARSAGFDPLSYISSEEDIRLLAKLIFDAISPNRNMDTNPYWTEAGEMCFRSLIGILWDLEHIDGCFSPCGDKLGERKYLRMNRLLDIAKLIESGKLSSDWNSRPLDYLVDTLESGKTLVGTINAVTNGYGARHYRGLRQNAPETLACVINMLETPLALLNSAGVRKMFECNSFRLENIDEEKRFIDIKISDNDSSYAFLATIFFKLLFHEVQKKADNSKNGRLARRLMFVLDEFPNIGRIEDFERSLATVRSRGINFLMCAQSLSQLNLVYGDEATQTILDNCDSIVYMGGGSSVETARYISDLCGDVVTAKANNSNWIQNSPVISASEIGLLPRSECLIKIAGARPFRTSKVDVMDHPNASRFLDFGELSNYGEVA